MVSYLFYNVLVTLVVGQFIIRDVGERKIQPLDFISVCLYGIGFTLFMLAVTFMKNGSIFQIKTILFMLLGIICIYIFVQRQTVSDTPILKLSLLTHSPLIVGTILLCIGYILMMAGTILVPLFIQTICGFSATISGFALLPGSLLIAILSPVAGKAMDKYGAKSPCIWGMLCLILGNGSFIFFNSASPLIFTVIAYAVRSLGLAILITACSAYAVHALSLPDKPHGTAITNSLRQMSGSLFSTILTIIATLFSNSDVLTITGLRTAFTVMTSLAILGIIVSVFCIPNQDSDKRKQFHICNIRKNRR